MKNPFPEPVKVAQLMTHTDGTTNRRIGLAARSASEIKPLDEYLAEYMPPIVWYAVNYTVTPAIVQLCWAIW